jgi:cobalt/nickel transport system permease protein
MHLPDGILTTPACATTMAVGCSILALAVVKSAKAKPSSKILGLAAAATILLQAVNFPISETVSGHFLGSALLGIIFGPWIAITIVAMVLGAQAILLGDGGIMAFGANLISLGIVPIFVTSLATKNSGSEEWSFHTASIAGAATLTGYLSAAAVVSLVLTFGSTSVTLDSTAMILELSLMPAIVEGVLTGGLIYWLKESSSSHSQTMEENKVG